jgi:hypothetical protein
LTGAISTEATRGRLVFAEPELAGRTPGEQFALAVSRRRGAADPGSDIVLPLAMLPSTTALPGGPHRYPVRRLLRVATVDPDEPVSYVEESPAGAVALRAAAFGELAVTVPVPAALVDEPALLAAFTDQRVLARLEAAEDAALLHGSPDGRVGGLLRPAGVRPGRLGGDLGAAVAAGAAEVEGAGGCCDGVVLHPDGYWRLVAAGLVDRLGGAGVRVCRSAAIDPDEVLLADFRTAATVLDPGVSSLALRLGAGPEGGHLIEARTRLGLAVQRPGHLVLLTR